MYEPVYYWYLCSVYRNNSFSFEILKLKEPHISQSNDYAKSPSV